MLYEIELPPDTNLGLVFRGSDDKIYLGVYEDGMIESFKVITDDSAVYAELPDTEFALVAVGVIKGEDGEDFAVEITDLGMVTLDESVEELFETGEIAEFVMAVYEELRGSPTIH